MRTSLDCVRCFFRQALKAARFVGASEEQQHDLSEALAKEFPMLSLDISPPEMAKKVYGLVNEVLDFEEDIYKSLKDKSTRMALAIYDDLKRIVQEANDALLAATELAAVGNIIDCGTQDFIDVEDEIRMAVADNCLEYNRYERKIFDYLEFKQAITNSPRILYLADNAGETVFDRVLIEEILAVNKKAEIVYAVRDKPIINDATMEDALAVGLDKVATVISSGSDAPGAVLSLCNKEFLKIYEKADIIISKGRGNFEALLKEKRPIFFLFRVKCYVIAREIKANINDIVLLYNKSRKFNE